MDDFSPSPGLTTNLALSLAARAAEVLGYSSQGAIVLGPVAENATVLLPQEQTVLRISAETQFARARQELHLAQWLSASGVPVTQPVGSRDPLRCEGWVVTAWREIVGLRPASTEVIGAVLAQLHQLQEPEFALPELDPLEGVEGYLRTSDLPDSDVCFLKQKLVELRQAWEQVEPELPVGPVHGDAHRKNIVQDAAGRPVVLDLERFSTGLREWDLVIAAVYQRLGWFSPTEYDRFVASYGWDVRGWEGFKVVAAVRELRMAAWLCARTRREPRLLSEARRRVASLRDPAGPRDWRPGV
ncbi:MULTISPECIES: phosphotransferase enzyme family protein [unclassified Nocardiopsis]|uniref:phosphotransferase enzyme family protein n=1 Tax=unclassified Nocardiopsis TaxID=2649073 RepID=UPI00135A4682|nr:MULTISPECIES: aminoglycoside phosphotransferase family protein [unclassified Nocardiopsis]